MKNKWTVLYYENSCPVQEFIDSRSIANQAKLLSMISYLELHGPDVPRPCADILQDGIHELRTKLSGEQIRTLYFFCYKEYIVLTHSFIKRTEVVPVKEIKRAQSSREDFLKRYNDIDLKKKITDND